MSAREGMSVDEALSYVDSDRVCIGVEADDALESLAAEVRRLRSPAPVFDMEAAVEAARPVLDLHNDDDAKTLCRAIIDAALPHIQPDMEALRRAARDVCWFDWSGNDCDAVEAICRLRDALAASHREGIEQPQHCPTCQFTMSGLGYCVNCPSHPADKPAGQAVTDAWHPIGTAPKDGEG